MYGEAPETVSVSTTTFAVATLSVPPDWGGTLLKSPSVRYVKVVLSITSWTKDEVLYGRLVLVPSTTPFTWMGVPTFNPCSVFVVTVILRDGIIPLPDLIAEISIGSVAKAPTISNSGLRGANPSGLSGYLSVDGITLVAAASLNAFYNLS